jgi:hypothetical protein
MRTHNGPPHGADRPRSLRPAERTNPGRSNTSHGQGDDENRFNSMDLSNVNVDENSDR